MKPLLACPFCGADPDVFVCPPCDSEPCYITCSNRACPCSEESFTLGQWQNRVARVSNIDYEMTVKEHEQQRIEWEKSDI